MVKNKLKKDIKPKKKYAQNVKEKFIMPPKYVN